MKRLAAFFLSLFAMTLSAQVDNPKYDRTLAESLGGDAYGMKQYVLAILKTGSNTTADKEKTNQLFRGHMDNIGRLVKENKLVVAGPLGKNDKQYRGIFIFDVKSVEEAAALVATDPAIQEKLLEVELYPWYGSAALPEYLKAHEKIEQKKH